MKKIMFLLFYLLLLPVSAGFAADAPVFNPEKEPWKEPFFPIQSITLTYDLATATLHVEAAHPSNNWERDYVRMMTVSLNGQEVSTLNYYHQTSAKGFSDDVSLKAQVGDVISVDVFCTQGSSMTQEITVAAADNSATNDATVNSAN